MSSNLIELPECWGCDTAWKIGAEAAKNLTRAPLPNGNPIKFIFRYVSLGSPSPGDITPQERDAILSSGLYLLLVQHVQFPGWTATVSNGQAHGEAAAGHAESVGYPPGAHLALDMEGLGNNGFTVADSIAAWCKPVIDAGFLPLLYVGYACGLTPKALYDLPDVHRYWKDAGPRSVDTRGFCCIQYPEVTVAGIRIDPDKHQADHLGGTLMGMSS